MQRKRVLGVLRAQQTSPALPPRKVWKAERAQAAQRRRAYGKLYARLEVVSYEASDSFAGARLLSCHNAERLWQEESARAASREEKRIPKAIPGMNHFIYRDGVLSAEEGAEHPDAPPGWKKVRIFELERTLAVKRRSHYA